MKLVRVICCILSLVIITVALNTKTTALSFHDIQTYGQTNIPEEYGLEIQTTYTQKPFFSRIFVREDGWFCLTSVCSDKELGLSYEMCFVDVYDAYGIFQFSIYIKEVHDPVYAELSDTHLILYFPQYIYTYDWNADLSECYQTERMAIHKSAYYSTFLQTKFSTASANYRCKAGAEGYTAVLVEKGAKETVLLTFPGNEERYLPLFFFGMVAILSLVIGCCVLIIQRKKDRGRFV